MEPPPLAVTLLCHPVGSFAALLTGIVAGLYAVQSRRFLPTFTALSAAALAVLAFVQLPPSATGLAWLAAGIALLHLEFLWPAFGAAGLLGVSSAAWGSNLLLAALAPAPRAGIAAAAALVLLAAVVRTMRLRTLPR